MRRYVLVCYDISDARRWRGVFKVMKSYGEHVQYSVFLCQLTDVQEAELEAKLGEIIHSRQDQVMFARIGSATRKQLDKKITTIGRPYIPRDIAKLIY
ncbi:CRISPR-associated endonuclease Cas2 [Bacillus sp. FSL W7-1360]